MKVLTCQQTRALEERAVLSGCTYSALMEQAGSVVAGYIRSHYDITEMHLTVLCGKGNNGGDGFVIAERLCDLSESMTVVLLDGLPVTELAQSKLASLRGTSARVINLRDGDDAVYSAIQHSDLIVDAVYGIGFHGVVSDAISPVFEAVNRSGAAVIAVDIPSGLNGDSNRADGVHIHADVTVTFSTMKPVHLFAPAKYSCGTVQISQVGIGKNTIRDQACQIFVPDKEMVRQVLKKRDPESHKGTFGRLFAICGSEGMAGAAVLSLSSAIRSGVGLVDGALPQLIYPIVAANVIEPVYTIIDTTNSADTKTKILKGLEKATACLIGCGLGQGAEIEQLVYDVLSCAKVPVILDADGLNAVARNIDVLKNVKAPVILTPHLGEMARLTGMTVQQIQQDSLQAAKSFAERYGVIVVLKGHNTIIAEPTWQNDAEKWGRVACNMTGNSGMAKGGSGDVLAGLIAGLCAQRMPLFEAAYTGVYLHGAAGDRAASRYSQHGMLPTHMVQQLSELFLDYE